MIVVPAVDLRHGRVVRLKQGQLQDETVYGSDPVAAAQSWEAQGAERLHVVDLDAAMGGKPQLEAIEKLIQAVEIPVEVGGGLRVLENAMRYRDRGADRLIFGTAAIAAPGVVQEAARLWGDAVAVAVDAKNGKVVVGGWNEITRTDAVALAQRVKEWGVARLQYTDTLRDGTLRGPNVAAIAEIGRASGLKITGGGGISTLDDLRQLAALADTGLDEVIVGRALYDERFTLAEAQAAVR